MIPKKELVKGLQRVKLVLGNGFDLHCHLKTSYADYFLYDKKKNEILNEWVNGFAGKARTYMDFNISNHADFWIDLPNLDRFTVWDIFFFLSSRDEAADIK